MKSIKKKILPTIGSELKEGIVPEAKVIKEKDLKKCAHDKAHHDSNGICHSCACIKFSGCGE